MRISDWSSDVCSSDLPSVSASRCHLPQKGRILRTSCHSPRQPLVHDLAALGQPHGIADFLVERSEERRGGKECVSTCRSRWSPYHHKKKQLSTTIITTTTMTDTCKRT